MPSGIRRETGQLNFFVGLISNRRGKSKFWEFREYSTPTLSLSPSFQFHALVGHPDLPIRKTLVRVVGLLTVMILERVSESTLFQSKRFTACKVKD